MATDDVYGNIVHYSMELGRGAFGTVYKAVNPEGEIIAVKKISTGTREDKRKASIEAMKLHYLKDKDLHLNDHISRIDDVKYWQNAAWIIMEYCDLGDLNGFFKDRPKFVTNNDVKFKLMRQIINGIAFLHDRKIVHRDIKPGNILLKLSPERHAVVKLGDFGLSKILDPDSLTSAMSSNVGTLSFKAPEFWDTAPDADGKVRYHRNVDVYAAGLTFAALLQAKPARSLMPKPEGSMQPGEAYMPIGLAALNRRLNRHTDVNIVNHQPNDTKLVWRIKSIIMEMTHSSPNQRLSARQVENKLQDPFLDRSGAVTLDFIADCVCLVDGKLAMRESKPQNSTLKLFNFEKNMVESTWQSRCPHFLAYGQLTVCPENETHLLEGCQHEDCGVIRRYDTQTGESTVVCENVEPLNMCLGPSASLLVFDGKRRRLLQLVFGDDGLLIPTRELELDIIFFHSMTYSALGGCVVVLDSISKNVTAINLASGDVQWRKDEVIDRHKLLEPKPEDIFAYPNGWVWVVNGGTVQVLNARNGDLVDAPSLALIDSLKLKSKDNPNIPDGSFVHKIMWSSHASAHKLAVNLWSWENLIIFDVTFPPEGPIIIEESKEESSEESIYL